MTTALVIQRITKDDATPGDEAFSVWAGTVLQEQNTRYTVTIRLVDEAESRRLNSSFRKCDAATNVLSFPVRLPADIRKELESGTGRVPLGDVVICVPVVRREAREQAKPLMHHWAHLVIHGILHLLGHDHADPEQAETMEQLEKEMLATLGIDDPYPVS